MDAETLKCKCTHNALSSHARKSRTLLHFISYLNDVFCTDPDFVDYKSRLGEKLSVLLNASLPSVNVADFGLHSCNLALYYQCVRVHVGVRKNQENERAMIVGSLRDLIDAWKRMVLGLDDAEKCLSDVYRRFCKIISFITYPKSEMKELLQTSGFVCPLCILTDAFSDIGWTDYVCPKPTADDSDAISKRGVDPDLPPGGCEHILSVKSTRYDRLHSHSQC